MDHSGPLSDPPGSMDLGLRCGMRPPLEYNLYRPLDPERLILVVSRRVEVSKPPHFSTPKGLEMGHSGPPEVLIWTLIWSISGRGVCTTAVLRQR